ncbi:hypothetical protein [Flavobacterium sp.]|uniref:hypothetical protein n=1 Tax=Flavobacterium sp. TaxID=239 RepID=UPI003F698AA2
MKKNGTQFVLNLLRIYLLGGIMSLVLLIYLVMSDPYFKNLDFKLENFKMKIDQYLLFTFYIPLLLLLLFCFVLLIKAKSKKDRCIIGTSSLFGVIGFVSFDNFIKKNILYPDGILLGLVVSFLCYLTLLFLVDRKITTDYKNIHHKE